MSLTVIVGAGVAGLVCARELVAAGRRVLVLERDDEVGGRVRTTVVDGYRLDHGFQVLFTAYPVLNGYLDARALDLREFLPAARIAGSGGSGLVGDALRRPSLLVPTLAARALPIADKLRLLALRRLARALTADECFAPRFGAVSTRDFLRARGFSERAIAGFFAPFYGGILLDRSLATSAGVLLFTFKMLSEGRTVVPAAGMGALSRQLASALPPGTVRTRAAVEGVVAPSGRVRGVVLADGTQVAADDVVLATPAPASTRLAATAGARLDLPEAALACATLYWSAAEAPLPGQALWLAADDDATVSHAVTLTEVAPSYAPPGRHLLSATVVGERASLPDDELARLVMADVRRMRGSAVPPAELLAVWRVPYAQYPQPPGFRDRRPPIAAGVPGLWLAGEVLHSSSLEGAARGGRDAARAVLAVGAARKGRA